MRTLAKLIELGLAVSLSSLVIDIVLHGMSRRDWQVRSSSSPACRTMAETFQAWWLDPGSKTQGQSGQRDILQHPFQLAGSGHWERSKTRDNSRPYRH